MSNTMDLSHIHRAGVRCKLSKPLYVSVTLKRNLFFSPEHFAMQIYFCTTTNHLRCTAETAGQSGPFRRGVLINRVQCATLHKATGVSHLFAQDRLMFPKLIYVDLVLEPSESFDKSLDSLHANYYQAKMEKKEVICY